MAQELEKEKGVMVDEEGFQQVTRSGKLKMAAAPPTIVANSFDVLSSEVGECSKVGEALDITGGGGEPPPPNG